MSSTVTPSSGFQYVVDAALSEYTKQTGIDIARYPFNDLQGHDSPDEILNFLQDKAKKFSDYRDGNHKLMKNISQLAHVLNAFSAVRDESVSVGLAQNLV